MPDISGKRIMILAANGFEQSELMVPKQKLEDAGATVDIVSLKVGEIRGWKHDDWGDSIEVDRTIDAVTPDEYDALVIPGGQINPDLLRRRRGRRRLRPRLLRNRESRSRRFVTRRGCWSRRASLEGGAR